METKSIETTDIDKLVKQMNKDNVNKRNIILFEHKDTEFICIYQKYKFDLFKMIHLKIKCKIEHICRNHPRKFKKGDIFVNRFYDGINYFDDHIYLYDGTEVICGCHLKGGSYFEGIRGITESFYSWVYRKANDREKKILFDSIEREGKVYLKDECKIVDKPATDINVATKL